MGVVTLLVNNCNPVRFPFDGDLDVYENLQLTVLHDFFVNSRLQDLKTLKSDYSMMS